MKFSFRYSFLTRTVVAGALIIGVTELLSLGHLLTRPAACIVWIVATIAAIRFRFFGRRIVPMSRIRDFDTLEIFCAASIVVVALMNLTLALIAAPSAWDALSYHAPRISHWLQNRSVAHYPTHIDRQLWITPGAEFFALHLRLLFGTDRFINLVQWLASLGCLVTTSLIAGELGARRKGQLIAALFATTIPMAVAQASGAQTDLFAAFWISAAIALLLRLIGNADSLTLRGATIIGLAVGLAVFAKATAYVVLAPFIVWALAATSSKLRARVLLPLVLWLTAAALINAGHLARNSNLYGSAFTNPRGVTVVNEAMTPGLLISNVARNTTLHTYTRSRTVNAAMQRAVESLHRTLGVDVNDPRTTFFITKYDVKARPRTEGRVGNQVHLLFIALVFIWLVMKRPSLKSMAYTGSIAVAFVLFCLIIKWQPWNSRLHLPIFVAASGAVGLALDRAGKRLSWLTVTILVASALPVLLRNAARPLIAQHPVWTVPREERYFIETSLQYKAHVEVADFLKKNGCSKVGYVTSWVDWEELLWAVMRNRFRSVRITHAFIDPRELSISPPSSPYLPDDCAIVTSYASPFLKPRNLTIPPPWQLALKTGALEVYLKTTGVPFAMR